MLEKYLFRTGAFTLQSTTMLIYLEMVRMLTFCLGCAAVPSVFLHYIMYVAIIGIFKTPLQDSCFKTNQRQRFPRKHIAFTEEKKNLDIS